MFGLNECKNVEIVCKLNSLPPGVDFFVVKRQFSWLIELEVNIG